MQQYGSNERAFVVYVRCQSRQASIVNRRPKGNFGIAVNDDTLAVEWQRLERLVIKCELRILRTLRKADGNG